MNRKQKRRFYSKIKKANSLGKRNAKGAHGGKNRFLGEYKTLKVVPKSKRTTTSCTKEGISKE